MRRLKSKLFWILLLITIAEEVTYIIPFLSVFLWIVVLLPQVGLFLSYVLIRYYHEATGKIPNYNDEKSITAVGRLRSLPFWLFVVMALVEDIVYILPLLSFIVLIIIIIPRTGIFWAGFFDQLYEDVEGKSAFSSNLRLQRYIEKK